VQTYIGGFFFGGGRGIAVLCLGSRNEVLIGALPSLQPAMLMMTTLQGSRYAEPLEDKSIQATLGAPDTWFIFWLLVGYFSFLETHACYTSALAIHRYALILSATCSRITRALCSGKGAHRLTNPPLRHRASRASPWGTQTPYHRQTYTSHRPPRRGWAATKTSLPLLVNRK
jgi:hypothetical protein